MSERRPPEEDAGRARDQSGYVAKQEASLQGTVLISFSGVLHPHRNMNPASKSPARESNFGNEADRHNAPRDSLMDYLSGDGMRGDEGAESTKNYYG
jgi:hypothetical protein